MKKLISILLTLFISLSFMGLQIEAQSNPFGKIIMIGDSYAELSYNGKVETRGKNDTWPGKLENLLNIPSSDICLKRKGGVGFSRTIGGINYLSLLEETVGTFKSYEVNIIMVVGGANDVKEENYKKVSTNLEKFITKAHELYPNAKIIISPVGWSKFNYEDMYAYACKGLYFYSSPDNWENNVHNYMTNYVIPSYKSVAKKYSYVYYATGSENVLKGKEKTYFTGYNKGQLDVVHPNIKGQDAIAEFLANFINNKAIFVNNANAIMDSKKYMSKLVAVYNSADGGDVRFKSVSGASEYIIMRKFNGVWQIAGRIKQKYNDNNTTIKFIDKAVKNKHGHGFFYAVAVVRNGILGDYNTNNPLKLWRLNKPEIINMKLKDNNNLYLEFKKQDVTGYEVQVSTDGGASFNTIKKTTSTNITISIKKGQKIIIRIRSYKNKNGCLTYSQYSEHRIYNGK